MGRKGSKTDDAGAEVVARADTAAAHLSRLVRIATVTPAAREEFTEAEHQSFEDLHAALHDLYPRTFAAAARDNVGRAGLLLRLAGASAKRPVVLMAHQDVVPVPEDWAGEGWEHPPFAGVIAQGRVHGRGTLDDKGALVCVLDAVESLLADGWAPARDLYLLFGADEESYGDSAIAATALLESRGIVPWLVLDEGGAVATGAFPGLAKEMAVVGATEKGLVTVVLTVDSGGGHASTPPRRSAPGILARALVAIEKNPFPAELNDVSLEMFEGVAPHLRGPLRTVLRRASSMRGVLAQMLPRLGSEMAAMVRTTTAITQLSGSPARNVLATSASATVNMRVAVGTTADAAVEQLRKTIGDKRVQLEVVESDEPSPVSPTGDDERFVAIGAAVAQSYPDAITVPYVMMAASDGRHLARISPAVYRFSPLRMDAEQRAAIHGPNENVEVSALGAGVQFYRALLTGPALGPATR
ncbi:M20/M25/M40 family metallo-hydrolase [Demequina oxidasica]|uniref:M20/M25/M40 family metallo-hydrolase n=1 Tax=Demequina oxidasica TaxID=676199 RepID=UPI0007808005|nr:M20/M25/M40 family metallo-hydrolase [Demequina oxidasica]